MQPISAIQANRSSTYQPPRPKKVPSFKLTLTHQDHPHHRLSPILRGHLLSLWLHTLRSNLFAAMGRRV